MTFLKDVVQSAGTPAEKGKLNIIMKKTAIFILLTLCANICLCQRSSLKHYYYWINQAELAICDSNYQKASDCYDKAFSCRKPFRAHAYLAFKVNSKYTHNNDRASECFHYLVMSGDSIQWYAEDSLMYSDLWPILQKVAGTTTSMVIPELRQALIDIRNSDQRVRRRTYSEDESWEDSLLITDSLNMVKLLELYKTYPVIDDYTTGSTAMNPAFCYHIAKEFLFDPAQIFYPEVLKGNVNASQYATTEDVCLDFIQSVKGESPKTRYGTTSSQFFILDTIGFVLEPENLKEVTKERKKILLSETWNDYAKKVAYRYQHETDFYLVRTTNLYYPPEEAEQIIKETITGIDNGLIKGSYYIIPEKLR